MNHIDILADLDAGTIAKIDAADSLAKHCHTTRLASLYLTCREERNEYREEVRALENETPRPTMDAGILLDLIDHALKTDYISAALAERWLLSVGLDADDAKHHVETIAAIKSRDAARAAFLERPDDALRYCTRCGIVSQAKHLSHQGICAECSAAAVEQAIEQLQAKTGPVYLKWRTNLLASLSAPDIFAIAATREREPTTLGDIIDLAQH